jgi:hypothetical protein
VTAGTPSACHACDKPATQQWQRPATDDETTAYHTAMDEWRKSQGLPPMPDTAAVRQTPALVVVYGCAEHGEVSA